MFSRNIHDPTLPIPIQTTSVRLLLNLVDYIFHNNDPDPQRGKKLLQRVLKVCTMRAKPLRHMREENRTLITDGTVSRAVPDVSRARMITALAAHS